MLTDHARLGVPADFAYASLHHLVTPAVLVRVFRRRTAHCRAARTWLLVSVLIGPAGFTLAPTCPPLLSAAGHGFTDTMAQYGHYGWWGGEAGAARGPGGLTDQYAAMPSLHVGWALWCGVVPWQLGGRGPWGRAAAVAHPLLTTPVVPGTANHCLLDAVAGAAALGAGLLPTRPALRCAGRAAGWPRRCAPAHARAGGPGTSGPEAGGPGTGAVPVVADLPGPRTALPRHPARPPGRGGPGGEAAPSAGDLNSPDVTTGCHTSPGERHPRQPTDDSPAPTAR
ncbi:phosphatase PAP2 family protein [Streptomyces sp.]|uniref:phosphatase PAP2 family protein n=1 Tax=Streptomyces sp. TaxID=1931 RepID=UPI0039C96B98